MFRRAKLFKAPKVRFVTERKGVESNCLIFFVKFSSSNLNSIENLYIWIIIIIVKNYNIITSKFDFFTHFFTMS